MPGIFGDGQRGGIFGARIDPRLQAELERRAATKQRELEPSLADQWHGSLANRILSAPSKLFGGLVVDPVYQASTLAGRMIRGEVPTWRADSQTADMHIAPELQDEAANAAGMLTLGAGAIPAETNALRMGIKAYHGSPHSFERFDASKIGTGEGAQAYGHGLYFAEREGVAKEYRNRLAPSAPEEVSPDTIAQAKFEPEWRKLVEELGPARDRRDRLYHTGEYQLNGAEEFQQLDKRVGEIDAQMNTLHQQMVDDTIARNPHLLKGRMYEVDIAAEPEHFLDWDKPLSEQPEKVQGALDKFLAPPQVKSQKSRDQTLHQIYGRGMPPETDNPIGSVRERGGKFTAFRESMEVGTFDNLPDAQKAVEKAYGDPPFWGRITSPEGASALREAGVPGIRYLDQGSRDPQKMKELADDLAQYKEAAKHWAETGNSEKLAIAQKQIEVLTKRISETRNFVIFPGNEHLISILKKYGLPISAAGLAALSQLHPKEAQAAQQKGKR